MTADARVSRRARDALVPLGAAALAAGLFLLALAIWATMRTGTFQGLDAALLRDLRISGHPDLPGGPRWLERLMRDATVLGGGRILTLVVIGASGLFVVRGRAGTAALLVIASYAGSLLVSLLKDAVVRPRPEIVPHLVQEASASFPSAHAANSAIVFLTLAALATRDEAEAATRRYTIGAAIALTMLIGVSRLYLGVHWPSDVLAGWCLGAGWATLTLIVAERLLPRIAG